MGTVQARRARKAFAVTVALVLLVVGACAAGAYAQETREEQGAQQVADASAASVVESGANVAAAGADAVSRALEDGGFAPLDEVPAWFEDEVLARGEMGEGYVAQNGEVVGFSQAGAANEVFARLTEKLGERGWLGYESGLGGVATFTKEEGTCTWLLMACSQVGDATSVVLRVQRA